MLLNKDDLDDLNDPDLRYISITPEQLRRALTEVAGCIACSPEADIPFDLILQDYANESGYVDYILPSPGICPNCKAEIQEKTLIQPVGGLETAVEI